MFSNLIHIFNDSFPLEENRKRQAIFNISVSFLIIVAVIIIKPFNLANLTYQMAKQIPYYLGFGLVSFLMLSMADYIIKPAFPVFFDEQFWTVKKNIVWGIFITSLVAMGTLFYANAIGLTGISGRSLLQFQFNVILYSIIPVALTTLLIRTIKYKQHLQKEKLINEQLKQLHPTLPESEMISFQSGSESLRIPSNQFLFAESAAGFSDIVYYENGILKRYLIPSDIKFLLKNLPENSIIRVHRGFVVNQHKIDHITANTQGYRIHFSETDQVIPLSERFSENILNNLRRRNTGN